MEIFQKQTVKLTTFGKYEKYQNHLQRCLLEKKNVEQNKKWWLIKCAAIDRLDQTGPEKICF
jgi:hypothetical protein